jgi:proline iminopeptidase
VAIVSGGTGGIGSAKKLARAPGRATRARRRLLDAIAFALAVIGGVVSRRPVRPLGDEDRRPLPGDALLPDAKGRWTHAITILASPRTIWPWLVQMGCRRGGWYSYDGLDNASVPSADRIHPELQQISVGDLMAWTAKAVEGFFVAEIEPERALVLRGDAGGLYRVAWAFVLEPIDAQTTRLLVRASGDYDRRSVGLMLQVIGRPMHFAMQRKQLLTLRKRIEAASRSVRGLTLAHDPRSGGVD